MEICSGITFNDLLNYFLQEEKEEHEDVDLMEVEKMVHDVEQTDGDVNTDVTRRLSYLRDDDGVFRATLNHLLRKVFKTFHP